MASSRSFAMWIAVATLSAWIGACDSGPGDPCVDCRDGGPADGGGHTDGSDGGGGGACNARNCNGCCAGNQCREGDALEACGIGGAPCTSCASTQRCDTGRCRCGPTTCDGCCDGDTCRTGGDETACGQAGEPCRRCSASQTCLDRACESGGCGFCPGCCDGASCRDGSETSACGLGGGACVACNPGEVCVEGVCNDPAACGPGICAGCCAKSTCQVGDKVNACGEKGGLCQQCSYTQTCDGGDCKIDPASNWSIAVLEAELDPSKGWDTLINTAPDPYVQVVVGQHTFKTSPLSNDYQPAWKEVVGSATAADITYWNLQVTIFDDDDFGGDEIIGACTVKVPEDVLQSRLGVIKSCPNPDGTNYVLSLRLSFWSF